MGITAERQAEVLKSALSKTGGSIGAGDLAAWAGYASRSAQRWLAGEVVMPLEAAAALIAVCPLRAVREAVLELLTGGSSLLVIDVRDLVGDEEPGAATVARAGGADVLRRVADLIERHELALADGRITEAEASGIHAAVVEAQRCLVRLDRRVAEQARSAPRFVQAKRKPSDMLRP